MPKKVSILILIAILFVSSSLANNIVSTDKKPLDEKFVIHKLNSKTQLPDRLTKLNLNAQLMNESSSNNHHKYIEIKRRIESGLTENYKMMPNKIDVFGELKFSKEKLLNAIENLNGDNGKRFAITFLTCLVDGDYCYIAGESYPNGWVIVLNVADTSNIFRVAQVPTQIFWIPSLAKSGNRLYVVGASHQCGKLKVIDVSNPSSPTIIGSMDVPDTTLFDIEVQGDYAIIGDRRGVRIVNIAQPNNLQTVGYVASLPWCFQLTVAGNFAYAISDCYKFAIIDITNPNTPNLRGSLEEIECFDVRVRDNRAYIACENGLGIIDVSNPDVPKLLYSNFETRWLSCVTDGNYTYATGVMDDGETFHGIVTIFDVADINNIKEVAQVGLGPLERENYGPSIFKSDNYIYVAGNVYETDNSKLWIIDVTNPILPVIKSEMTFADMTVRDIFVQNNFAYIAHFEPGGLRIVDVSIPENPITRSVLEIENCYSVFILGSYAYVIEGFQNLVAVDVSNPDQPIRRGDIELDLPRDVCVRSNYAYVCGDNALFVVDVSNPDNLQLISDEVEASGHTIEFFGNYAYIAGDGLYVVDITSLANPFIASTFADCYSYEIDAISVQGNFVYNTYQDELRVIDCSDFGPPQIGRWGKVGLDPIYVVGDVGYCGADWKGIYPGLFTFDLSISTNPDTFTYYNVTGERVYDIYVSGNYAYLANGASGLRIINISDPEHPQEVGNYPTPDSAFGVSVIYPYAYVACRDAGLRIINVSEMTPPQEVGAYVCENARKVFTVQTVLNTYAYVVGGFYGFLILDVTMPSNIVSIGSYYGFASDITVRNNLAYVSVTHWEPGLHIVDISTPSIPTRIGYFPLDTKSTSRLYLNNNLIYLTHHYATTIIDVSTPQSPVRIGSINTRSYDVWANNNYAYITGHGLRIFDVYDPTGGIYIAGRYKFEPEEYCAWTLELSGDYAYTAWGGLYIYDVATYPTIPLFLADFSDCDCEEHDGISVQNGLVYNVFERQLNIIDCNDLGNIFICGSYELEGLECSISGIKFNDINGNGQKDPEDYGIPNWTIRLDPGPIFTKTNSLGEYTFTDLPYGTYTVSEETKNYWQQTCPINGTYTVVLDNVVPNVSDSNFGNHASTEIQDLACGIGGGVARPGIYKKYHITYENKGTVTVDNVVVTCTIPTQVMYVNCSSGGIYNGIGYGGTVTWNIGPVIPCAIEWLWVEVYIPTSLGIGTELHSAVNIEPLTGDFNPTDNYDDETEIVVGSYDPNEKSVTPEGLITQTTELEYFVRFQNVGTAPAIDIEITDTLDNDLDPSSVTLIATSHPYTVFAKNGNVLIWRFININLPDSASDEAGSHGFVKYTVKPYENATGPTIENRAAIVFDYNPAVLTNTTINYFGIPGWTQKEPVETSVANAIKEGGALVGVGNELYAFVGTKTNKFKKYTIGVGWTYTDNESLPFGYKYPIDSPPRINKKFPGKGAALCYDGVNTIYATRGNGTREFWSFNLTTRTWTREESIPVPKGVKGGTALAFMNGKVYLLAGAQKKTDVNNFYVFDTITRHWSASAPLELGSYTKVWKDGSCLAVCDGQIYALKGGDKDNLFYAFDGTNWTPKETLPKPDTVFGSFKAKVLVKAGGCMASDGNVIYAVKGGGTDCFWQYTPGEPGVWEMKEPIPVTDKKHAPKTGAAMAYAAGQIWLLVGNKQPDFWCYAPSIKSSKPTTVVSATIEKPTTTYHFNFEISPNPFNRLATIRYTVPNSGDVTIKLYNASGRLIKTLVNEHLAAGNYTLVLSAEKLAKGIYFVKCETSANSAKVKLIVQ